MKNLLPILMLGAALAMFGPSASAQSAEGKPTAAAAEKAPATKPINFRGTISAVDSVAKSVTITNVSVASRVFHVTSSTRIVSGGKPAVFADAKPGEEAGGSFRTAADGRLELVSLRIGPVPKKVEPQTERAPVK